MCVCACVSDKASGHTVSLTPMRAGRGLLILAMMGAASCISFGGGSHTQHPSRRSRQTGGGPQPGRWGSGGKVKVKVKESAKLRGHEVPVHLKTCEAAAPGQPQTPPPMSCAVHDLVSC